MARLGKHEGPSAGKVPISGELSSAVAMHFTTKLKLPAENILYGVSLLTITILIKVAYQFCFGNPGESIIKSCLQCTGFSPCT